ncbi:hypothetical protein [Ureibacillus aquaedulcis]|uniref:Uncharacterized protein n=1 Tax=Ureibacillus aquaedulcis TaxID=3058421 RepID=A0ABT8GNT2_9BACL|nr:hypothetical protein [Ureibacillus sp. BA0131]MDN4492884.1 hypothetical protein [Ureibacillus sp. BA0131]
MMIDEEQTINVVDAICGAGKTSWAIQMLNDSEIAGFGDSTTTVNKYIYVTPYLEQVERVIKATKADFFQPNYNDGTSKLENFKMLVALGKNIVTTHEIFKRLDSSALNEIAQEGYTLIMDEAAQVIEQLHNIVLEDMELLLEIGAIEIGELGKVHWLRDEVGKKHNSKFHDVRIMAENDTLFLQNGIAYYWTMNVKAFEVFDEIFILTYLFDAQEQKYYYDMHDVNYEKYSVVLNEENKYELIDYDVTVEPRKELYNLLNIYEGPMNYNFDYREKDIDNLSPTEYEKIKKFQLSSRWFDKAPSTDIAQMNKNLLNYFTNVSKQTTKDLFWTTLSSKANELSNKKCKFNRRGNRENDNFLPFNARATNAYANRTATAFVYNRFMNPNDKKFFLSRGVEVNQDLMAVSDLIQYLFRGCIREGKPMDCYIPSERMRNALKDWSEYKI